MNTCKIQAKDTSHYSSFVICDVNCGIVNVEDVLLRRISCGSVNSLWSIRLQDNLWHLISKRLTNTNLLKFILDSHLSNFVSFSARLKFVEVRYDIQAGTPAASPTRGPTVAHISRAYIPPLLWMVHF